jgi:hypothetical protein
LKPKEKLLILVRLCIKSQAWRRAVKASA